VEGDDEDNFGGGGCKFQPGIVAFVAFVASERVHKSYLAWREDRNVMQGTACQPPPQQA
jgi:hypothetical protein